MLETVVEQWFSVCELGASSMGVSWTLQTCKFMGPLPGLLSWEFRGGPSNLCSYKASLQVMLMQAQVQEPLA